MVGKREQVARNFHVSFRALQAQKSNPVQATPACRNHLARFPRGPHWSGSSTSF